MLSVIVLSVMLTIFMGNVVMLSVVMSGVFMLSAVLLNVVAPYKLPQLRLVQKKAFLRVPIHPDADKNLNKKIVKTFILL